MQMKIGNVITVRYPNDEIREFCQQHLTLPNPEYQTRLRMNLWTGNTAKYIYLYEVRGNDVILPYGTLRHILARKGDISEENIIDDFPQDVGKVKYEGTIPLYDYQEKAVQAMTAKMYGILQAPAGSGKTQMGIALVQRWGRRALWLTHTKDLLKQSKDRAGLYFNKALLGTITEGEVNIGKGITFATIQTMAKLDLSQYKYYWDLIIVDECHRVAGSPTRMTQFYKVLNSLSARHKYGLSATVHRSDGTIQSTYALLGTVQYEVPQSEVADKIMPVSIAPIATNRGVPEKGMNPDGTLAYVGMITGMVVDEERNKLIAEYLKKMKGHSILILSERVNHLMNIMDLLPEDMQKDSTMIHGRMTTAAGKIERDFAIEDMIKGKKKYLFATYQLAKEGLDIPCLDRLFLTTPQHDYAVVTQSIGRVARTYPGKETPIVLDFVDNFRYALNQFKTRCRWYKKAGCDFVEVE